MNLLRFLFQVLERRKIKTNSMDVHQIIEILNFKILYSTFIIRY